MFIAAARSKDALQRSAMSQRCHMSLLWSELSEPPGSYKHFAPNGARTLSPDSRNRRVNRVKGDFEMKNQIYRVIAILGVFLGMAVASAQGQTPSKVEVNIPFEFSAGKATLKPGVYSIRRTSANLLILRDSDGKSVILNAPLSIESKDKAERLVFNKSGEKYSLTQIWLSGETGRQLLPDRKLKDEKAERVEIAIRVR
jgi:hypothetical protein